MMDFTYTLLSLILISAIAGTFQECGNGFNLKNSNITASMDRAKVFDANYSNPEYAAMFQQNKAFCVIPYNSFHIQVDFKKIVTVTTIKVQGFILNKESLMMHAFSLKFSIDGSRWYDYNYQSGAKYLVTSFNSDNGDRIMHHELEMPIATRFMRLLPQQPTNSFSEKVCLRMKVFGCEEVFPPKVQTQETVKALVSGTTTLTCNGVGTFGLSLGWDKNNMQRDPNPEKLYTVKETVKQDVVMKLSDLTKLQCQRHPQYLSCKKLFACYGSYYFQNNVLVERNTTMVLDVYFPDQPRSFQVKSRTKSSVTIAWETPNLRNLTIEMLEYVIKCSHDNQTEILPMTVQEKTIHGLGVYKPYSCSLKVQLRNSTLKEFPFKFSQSPVILQFHSSTMRPNLVPKMELKVKSPTQIDITIPPVYFSRKEYGVLKGFHIHADLLRYGEQGKVVAYFGAEQLQIVKNINNPNLKQYTMNNVVPWSTYRVSLSVYNNDNLTSNATFTSINMPEGVPSRGVTLIGLNIKKTMLVIQTTHLKRQYRCGKILRYETVMNPGPDNRTFIHTSEICEIQSLKPNTVYTLRCRAGTIAGFGPFGPPFSIRTAEDLPSAPLDVHLVGDINSVKKDWHIVWSKPEFPNGNITAYGVELELKNGSIVTYETNHEVTHYHVRNTPKDAVKKIDVRAKTMPGWGPRSLPYFPTEEQMDPRTENLNNVILVAAVVFAVIFLLILICLCVILNRRRTTALCVKDPLVMEPIIQRSSTSSAHIEDEDDNFERINLLTRNRSDSVGTGNHSIANYSRDPIKVEDFAEYMLSMKTDDYGVLLEEFTSVSSGKCSPCQIAELPENRDKNRYVDIRPYDHSRVVLKTESGRKSDYINASYVQGFNHETTGPFRYISSQGPLDNTQNNFWTMIWQEEVTIIVMLTNLVENGRPKCSQYWPNESKAYGDLTVTLEKIDKTADYVTRYFKVEKKSTEEARVVSQFHFVSWPDHGVPDYPTAILSLRRRIRHSYDPSKPMLVHCSAGVGRSGCFILIDAMLERIDHDKTVDVFNYLRYTRSRRINMVQTFEQYRLAHTAILEYITFGNTEIFVGELDKRIRQLGKNNGMANEFELLTSNTTPVPSTGNPYQVLLRDQFIDAYHVDGYKQRDGFIITKAATENNAGDFWKMVLDKQCHTIVMLNKCQEPTQEFYKYWPDVENHCVYEDTTVLTTSEVANGNIITRKIKVTTNKRKCEVYHFQYVDWPSADIPHRRGYTNICTLMQAVEKSQQNLGNGPIIVHGGNGYGRSGTFISIYNSTERLKVEQLIDVLQCVRTIRISQPLAVDNITQYQFVYNMLRTYLEGFENYWNYKDYKVTRSPLNSTST